MAVQFAFVTVGGSGRTKPTDRSLVRSRCMLGKNIQEGSRRSKRAARRAQRETKASGKLLRSERLLQSLPEPSRSQAALVRDGQLFKRSHEASDEGRVARGGDRTPTAPVPRPPPGDISLIRFADELDKPSQEVLFRYKTTLSSKPQVDLLSSASVFNFNSLKMAFYPIKNCVDLPRSPNSEALSLSWILQDKSFLHSVLFYTSAIHEHVQHRRPGKTTQFHLRRTITLLNEALSQKDSHHNEAVFHVILTLALIAGLWGDFTTTTAVHLSGLQ